MALAVYEERERHAIDRDSACVESITCRQSMQHDDDDGSIVPTYVQTKIQQTTRKMSPTHMIPITPADSTNSTHDRFMRLVSRFADLAHVELVLCLFIR